MAVTLPPAYRRQGRNSDSHRNGEQELRLLASDTAADAGDGAVLSQGHTASPPERCARRSGDPCEGCCIARPRQNSVRRTMRPVPLQQDSDACCRPGSRWLLREGLSELLEQVLGVDQDRGFQVEDA